MPQIKSLILFLIGLFIATFTSVTFAQSLSWNEWVKQVRTEALAEGIRPEVFDRAFRDIKEPHKRVLHFDRTQPETRLTFLKYRNTRADAFRIKLGRMELKKHHELLEEISHKFGVSSCFIVSLWGLETSYGRFMGSFGVIKSLATLAYDNRRAKFFRKQLFYALHILNDGHVDLEDFKGEWAGASGQPQFLPSSWHHYAVDYNADGRKDIWKTHSDVFASIANYLVKNGWKRGEPWAIVVTVPANIDKKLLSRDVVKTVGEWEQLGVKPYDSSFPDSNLQASVVEPYGGPTMMIFNNFSVIMKWNRSIYYAGTVGYMAEKVCQKKL